MKRFIIMFMAAAVLVLHAPIARAHFGALIPSDDIVSKNEGRNITLNAMFIHPMENSYMQMGRPARFGVLSRGKRTDLTDTLREKKVKWFSTWSADYEIRRPGDHVFFVEPEPYWEPAEGRYIIHYTKVVVSAFGLERGWDDEVGLKTEIVPLTRPYGLWTGNVFRGIVKVDGKAVPYAEVEVEYLNTAAISEADKKMERDGRKVPVEIGAVIWVRTRDMK